MLLVEHHMAMVMGISDKVVAMDFGRKIAEGAARRGAARIPHVIAAYLGTDDMTALARASAGCRAGYGPVEVLHRASTSTSTPARSS